VTAAKVFSSRRVVSTYIATNTLFTLSTSVIWSINTLFLMGAGLTIFEVMLVNATFTLGELIFEVPTGVIADTIGRKASFLIASASLLASTLLYVAAAQYSLGIWWFVIASVMLGFGFACQTGAVDAWLVDALDFTGFMLPKERVFAWNGAATGAATLVGTLGGGFLGQVDLAVPYVVRAGLLAITFFVTLALMREVGFEPRPLKMSSFTQETRKIFDAGVRYGWRHKVVRPLLWVSLAVEMFMFFAFYSWQRYALDLLGRDYVWVVGVLVAGFSLMSIIGNSLVRRIMETRRATRREAPVVLGVCMAVITALAAGMGVVGLVFRGPGLLPFGLAAGMWLAYGFLFGVIMPVRQGFLNEQIPSARRATVLSLDSFFGDAGGAAGQPALGWLAQRAGLPISWVVGSLFLGISVPLYDRAARASREMAAEGGPVSRGGPPAAVARTSITKRESRAGEGEEAPTAIE
jgi:MFS family permease